MRLAYCVPMETIDAGIAAMVDELASPECAAGVITFLVASGSVPEPLSTEAGSFSFELPLPCHGFEVVH